MHKENRSDGIVTRETPCVGRTTGVIVEPDDPGTFERCRQSHGLVHQHPDSRVTHRLMHQRGVSVVVVIPEHPEDPERRLD